MTDAQNDHEVSRPATADTEAPSDGGTLVAWTVSDSNGSKSHIVHIGPEGMTWALGLSKQEVFAKLVGQASARPADAASLIQQQKNGRHVPRNQIARVTYTKGLSQLLVFDASGKKQKIAKGDSGEQEEIFAAAGQYLGGKASEEEADAWSVMQGPLFAIALFGAIGAFFIYGASEADPNYEATGRRRGMKQLINWIGYTVGPKWMSVILAAGLLLIFAFMILQLVKRPKRQVLEL